MELEIEPEHCSAFLSKCLICNCHQQTPRIGIECDPGDFTIPVLLLQGVSVVPRHLFDDFAADKELVAGKDRLVGQQFRENL